LYCQECPKKAYCSDLCPEARAYANQDCLTRREYFSFPEAQYSSHDEILETLPKLSKTEWKIVTLLKKGLTRREACEILGISRQNLRNVLLRIKRKGYAFSGHPD
jgi:DNA-binding NarL/FixJ family response regulator